MKKLLLLLLLPSASLINAMARFTLRNYTSRTIQIDGHTTMRAGESRQFVYPEAQNLHIKGETQEANAMETTVVINKETTLLTITQETPHSEDNIPPYFITTQKKSRPLTILNKSQFALLLTIHRPGNEVWTENIPCPDQTDLAFNIPADADTAEIFSPAAPSLIPKFSARLTNDIHGIEVACTERIRTIYCDPRREVWTPTKVEVRKLKFTKAN